MSELSDKLADLLGNEESRKKLFETASELGLIGEKEDAGKKPGDASPSVSDALGSLFSGGEKISGKKLALLKAFVPYFSDARASLAKRAIRIAGTAAALKDALGFMER